ncbi:MAG: hypothetical protein ACC653_11700 [Gammaproteobacteria bacterium]
MVLKKNIIKNSMIVIVLSFVLASCTSDAETWRLQLEKSSVEARTAVDNLGKHLNSGTIAKSSLLTQYAAIVKKQDPSLAELSDTLALDATVEGPSYKSLVNRVNEANVFLPKAPAQGLTTVQALADEYQAIKTASRTDIYSMMLTDPINVLADMSKGKLGRVESMSKEASLIANGAQDYGAGSQLVDNPQYGQWRNNSSGGSFWEWYGKYALFSSLFRSPIYYGAWSRGRNYSYYGEAGRNYYNSPRQQAQSRQTQSRTRTKFQREGKRFQSPYAKSKAGSRRATQQSNSFKTARSSSRMASSRSSSFRTSRSSYRGK